MTAESYAQRGLTSSFSELKRRQVFVLRPPRMLLHQNHFIVGVVAVCLFTSQSGRRCESKLSCSRLLYLILAPVLEPTRIALPRPREFFFSFSSPPLPPRVTSIRKRLGSSWKRSFDFLHLKKCTGGLCVRLPCPFDSFAHLHDNTLQDSRPRFLTSNFKLFKMVFNHPEYIIGYKFMEMCFASVAIVNI